MGQVSIDQAIGYLSAAGLRADRGYPGSWMPNLTGPVVAVNVKKAEPGKLTLVATVCQRTRGGAWMCEDTAAKAAEAWTAAGAVCSYSQSQFDGRSGLHTIEVLGVWEDAVEETSE